MTFINESTSKNLDILVGAFFDLNRTLDRCVSVMKNDWSMGNASAIIHHKLAHLMPLMADEITEIKDNYNLSSTYPMTHEDSRNYTDLEDMFDTVMVEFSQVHGLLMTAQQGCALANEWNVVADLMKIVRQYNIIMGQIYTLADKAEQMPQDYDKFDKHIDVWGIDGVDLSQCNLIEKSDD